MSFFVAEPSLPGRIDRVIFFVEPESCLVFFDRAL